MGATTSADEMRRLLDEAKAKADAHKGVWFTLDGARFELWPRRLTFAQRKAIRSVLGRPIESAIADLVTGEVGADTVAGLVWAAVYQADGKRLPPAELDGLLTWVADADEFDAGELDPPDALTSGDAVDDVDALDDAGVDNPEA